MRSPRPLAAAAVVGAVAAVAGPARAEDPWQAPRCEGGAAEGTVPGTAVTVTVRGPSGAVVGTATRADGTPLRTITGARCESVLAALEVVARLAAAPTPPPAVPAAEQVPERPLPVDAPPRPAPAASASASLDGGVAVTVGPAPYRLAFGPRLGATYGGIARGVVAVEGRWTPAAEHAAGAGRYAVGALGGTLSLSGGVARGRFLFHGGPTITLDRVEARAAGERPRAALSGRVGARIAARAAAGPLFAEFFVGAAAAVGRDRFFSYVDGPVTAAPALCPEVGFVFAVKWDSRTPP